MRPLSIPVTVMLLTASFGCVHGPSSWQGKFMRQHGIHYGESFNSVLGKLPNCQQFFLLNLESKGFDKQRTTVKMALLDERAGAYMFFNFHDQLFRIEDHNVVE